MSKYIIGCLVCAYLWAPNIRYKVENDLFGGPWHISVLVQLCSYAIWSYHDITYGWTVKKAYKIIDI